MARYFNRPMIFWAGIDFINYDYMAIPKQNVRLCSRKSPLSELKNQVRSGVLF